LHRRWGEVWMGEGWVVGWSARVVGASKVAFHHHVPRASDVARAHFTDACADRRMKWAHLWRVEQQPPPKPPPAQTHQHHQRYKPSTAVTTSWPADRTAPAASGVGGRELQ